MSNKLRRGYDRAYIGLETYLLARADRRSAREYARSLGPVPDLAREYADHIRPYWARYKVSAPGRYWFARFVAEGRSDPRFIPNDLWFSRIIPHYNNLIFAKALQDKCLHNVLFPDMARPVTVVKNIAGVFYDDDLNLLAADEAAARCVGRGRVIVKPSVGSGQGHGIRFYDADRLTDGDVRAMFRLYGENFIVQEKMAQHPVLAAFNPHSLNTVRIVTFLHGGEARALSAILRIGGTENEVDNVSQGGFQCTVLPDGRLDKTAVTKQGGRWSRVEACAAGIRFADITVPGFDRAVETVCRQARRMSHFKIIGWDIAIDPDGTPVLVEYNVIPDQNQATCGPTFGELTDQVLTEVFGPRHREASP